VIASANKLLLFFLLCLLFTSTRAQYRIDQWTADDGLPQNSVYGIVQTGDGYLWLATVDGLARFDGARFTVFNKSNSTGIVNNRFVSLFEAANGDLWAGTEESGAGRFRGRQFEHFSAEESGVPRIVYWIVPDAGDDGVIFINDNQTVRFSDGKFSPFEAGSTFPAPTRAARSSSIKILCRLNSENNLSECFINGQWQSFSLADGSLQDKLVSVAQATNPRNSPQVRSVSAAQEANGRVWLITADGKLARAENGLVTRVYDERDGLPKFPLYFITGSRLGLIAKDSDGALWLVELPSMQKELLLKKAAVLPLLDKAETLSTYQDNEGNLWFGTRRDGLFRARKQVVTAYSEADGISEKNVYPIYEDRAGTIWIGTTSGLFKRENGTFTVIESTKTFHVSAIGEDVSGRILISNRGALYVQENNRFVPFEQGKIPADDFIYAIHADRENSLWLGGEKELMRFKDGVLTGFTTADGLAGNDVKVIIEARAGGLWIGTYDGLTRLQNDKFTSWRETDGLPSRTVRSLYEDADGVLWIGSYDGGLARFKDGKFTRYDTKMGLPNDGAFQILEDDRRNFWISSNRGIYRVAKDELNEYADGKRQTVAAIAYGKADGMLNAEANGGRSPAGIRAQDGRLWFPTQDGVAVIDPETVKVNPKPPPVMIETVKIDNALIAECEQRNAGCGFDKENSAIRIEPHQQSFEITYTALSFINSENLRFKYKLEGLDSDWVDAGTRRTAYFSHVPPGKYAFRVIAANSDNVWNEQGAAIEIVVHPAFYQTWWFLVSCAAAIGLITFGIYQRRLNESRRRQFAQEEFSRRLINSHETERRRVAAELHDSIGQSLAMIKNSAVFGSTTANDLSEAKEQLAEISTQSAQAISEVREIAYNLRPYLVDRLGLTKAIGELLEKVEDSTGLEIDEEIEEIDDIFDKEAEISVYRIIQESLNNILKHADATKVRVSIAKTERSVKIEIADNGKGFDVSAAGETKRRGGFGLLGMNERVRMLGGTIAIESAAQEGAKIIIELWKHK
jgi:signal transduction histidine kinase/ligand-binding sensor domain-containing protein